MWKIVERCHRIEVNERGEIRYRDTGKMASTSVNAVGYIQVGVWVCGLRKTAQGYYWKFAEGVV